MLVLWKGEEIRIRNAQEICSFNKIVIKETETIYEHKKAACMGPHKKKETRTCVPTVKNSSKKVLVMCR